MPKCGRGIKGNPGTDILKLLLVLRYNTWNSIVESHLFCSWHSAFLWPYDTDAGDILLSDNIQGAFDTIQCSLSTFRELPSCD